MCELLGLSASQPVPARDLPLVEFRRRGGELADNPDGWGMAWREPGLEAVFRVVKEPVPAWQSPVSASLVGSLNSDLVVAHVRKARFPPVNTLNNTHPFLRACCGRSWVFAHNGLVPDIVAMEAANRGRVCQPEGETDSEFAFCHLLSHVARHFDHPEANWLAVLGQISRAIAERGKFNFLLSDGIHLIAYGHDRLHYLETTAADRRLALLATEPLSGDAGWTPFLPGELRIYRSGALVERPQTLFPTSRALGAEAP
jgi:glutamine amidotransferase